MTGSKSLLHVTDGYGTHKFYVDGRRVTKNRFNEIHGDATRLDSMTTVRKNGAWYFYTSARFDANPPTHVLLLRSKHLNEDVHREEFRGDDLSAEHRLNAIWNDKAAHLPGRGLVATLVPCGATKPTITIS